MMNSPPNKQGLNAIALGASFALSAFCAMGAQAAPPNGASISPNDPAIVQLRMEAEQLRRFDAKSYALWDELTQEEKDKVRLTVALVPNPTKAMPALLPLLREGNRAGAEFLVKKTYSTDDKMASVLTSLIGYANEIDTEPLESAQKPTALSPASGKAAKSTSARAEGPAQNAAK